MLECINYLDVVASQLQVDLRISVVKTLYARWTISSFRVTGCDTAEILRGWPKAGISTVLEVESSHTSNNPCGEEECDIED